MLEPLDLQEARVIACLEAVYGLSIAGIAFLPLGADVDRAVYRVVADDATPYFLKLCFASIRIHFTNSPF